MSKMRDGEYVLATRFSDGDPRDRWAFGFLKRLGCYSKGRHYYSVLDVMGNPIGTGYTRARRISKDFGDWLVQNINLIESSRRSLWWWMANYQNYTSSEFKFGGKK